ncbi:MAG: hypothetical protein WD872_04700 [Pirellulaceae bacterium]
MNHLPEDPPRSADELNNALTKWIVGVGSVAAVLAFILLYVVSIRVARLSARQTASSEVASEANSLAMPDGVFGTKWLMSHSEVHRSVPSAVSDGAGSLIQYSEVYGRPAKISYGFQNSYLLIVVVTFLGESDETSFAKTHALLIEEHGPVPNAVSDQLYRRHSKKKVGRFLVEHDLQDIGSIPMEQIIFCRTSE